MLWLLALVLGTAAASFLYPLLRKTYFTPYLVLANLLLYLVFILLLIFAPNAGEIGAFVVENLLFRPTDLVDGRYWTLITAMFLHASPLHVVFNILFLYLLGLPLEERIGGPTFGALYLSAGIAASLLYATVQWGSIIPALGASGAIMGIAGAFLALYPRERIFFILGFFVLPRTPVYLAVGVVLLGEAVLTFAMVQDGVAHAAHIGGLAFGIAVAPLIRRSMQERPMAELALEDLATSEELRETLARIEEESVAEVRDAWVDHFLAKAACPQCQGPLTRTGRAVVSTCGWQRQL